MTSKKGPIDKEGPLWQHLRRDEQTKDTQSKLQEYEDDAENWLRDQGDLTFDEFISNSSEGLRWRDLLHNNNEGDNDESGGDFFVEDEDTGADFSTTDYGRPQALDPGRKLEQQCDERKKAMFAAEDVLMESGGIAHGNHAMFIKNKRLIKHSEQLQQDQQKRINLDRNRKKSAAAVDAERGGNKLRSNEQQGGKSRQPNQQHVNKVKSANVMVKTATIVGGIASVAAKNASATANRIAATSNNMANMLHPAVTIGSTVSAYALAKQTSAVLVVPAKVVALNKTAAIDKQSGLGTSIKNIAASVTVRPTMALTGGLASSSNATRNQFKEVQKQISSQNIEAKTQGNVPATVVPATPGTALVTNVAPKFTIAPEGPSRVLSDARSSGLGRSASHNRSI